MEHFSYSFCLTLLHSLWQAALLFLLFILIERFNKNKTAPLQKRDALYILLLSQIVLSVFTFFISFFKISNNASLDLMAIPLNLFSHSRANYWMTESIFFIYCAVVLFKLFSVFFHWNKFKKLYRSGLQKPSPTLKLFTALQANYIGVKRKVALWCSDTISVPVTFGFFKPVIVLPVALINQISMKEAEMLIIHELSHIRANDFLLNLCLVLAENLFFFNPFVRLICKNIRLEREKYCDAMVINLGYESVSYAETLMQAQYFQQRLPQIQLAATSSKNQLLKRVLFFTQKENLVIQNKPNFLLSAILVLMAILIGGALFFQGTAENNSTAPTINGKISPVVFSFNRIENPVVFFKTEGPKNDRATVVFEKEKIIKVNKKANPVAGHQAQSPSIPESEIVATVNESLLTPVSFDENAQTFQVIINEQESGSNGAVLKVYNFKLENGKWTLIPKLMIEAKEKNMDSLSKKSDSANFKNKLLQIDYRNVQ